MVLYKRFSSAFSSGVEENPWSGHRIPSVLVDSDQRASGIAKLLRVSLPDPWWALNQQIISVADNYLVILI